MRVIRYGFKLMWQEAPRDMRRYGIGKEDSFDPLNAHHGVIWGWGKECRLTDAQAKTIFLACYTGKRLTLPMLTAVRKSFAYAYELTGGEPKGNYDGVKDVWTIVREATLPQVTMSQKPTRIPDPPDMKRSFRKEWNPAHPWCLMKFLGGTVAANDVFCFGLRSREDVDRVKKSFTHEFDWEKGWQCTSFKNGRAKLSGNKRDTRPWWIWRVCNCRTKRHVRPAPNFCEKIGVDGNPTVKNLKFSTVCPLAALELMWQMQWHDQKPRCYGKWLASGRYGKSNVDDVAAFAIDWLMAQGATTHRYDSNSGRMCLATMTRYLGIDHPESFQCHGDLPETWIVYDEQLPKSSYAIRTQSRIPKVACACLRKIAQYLGAGKKVKPRLSKQERFSYNVMKGLGMKKKAEKIRLGLPSSSEEESTDDDSADESEASHSGDELQPGSDDGSSELEESHSGDELQQSSDPE